MKKELKEETLEKVGGGRSISTKIKALHHNVWVDN